MVRYLSCYTFRCVKIPCLLRIQKENKRCHKLNTDWLIRVFQSGSGTMKYFHCIWNRKSCQKQRFLKRFIICFHKSREGGYIRQNIENVQSSHGLLRRWKGRNFTKFKILLGGSRAGHQIWSMCGPEPILNFLSNHDLKNIYIANRDD